MSDANFDHDDFGEVFPCSAFTGRAEDDSPCAMVGVDREAPQQEGVTPFIASTFDEDRHNTVFDQNSWRLANYRRNPVVLLNHDRYESPVGRSEEVRVAEYGTPRAHLRLVVHWDMEDPRGVLVAGKYARKFLNSGSINAKVGKTTDRSKLPPEHIAYRKPREDDSPWLPALFFERQELVEFSGVTIPSNVKAEAIRSWGARQLADIRTTAAESTEDPDERIRRIATEIVDARGLDLVMRALRSGGVEIRALLTDLVFGSARREPAKPADPWAGFFPRKEG